MASTILLEPDESATNDVSSGQSPQTRRWQVVAISIFLVILAIAAIMLITRPRPEVVAPSTNVPSPTPRTIAKPPSSRLHWGAPLPREHYHVGQALAVRWFLEPSSPNQVYVVEITQSQKLVSHKRTTMANYYYQLGAPGDYVLTVRPENASTGAAPLNLPFSVSPAPSQ